MSLIKVLHAKYPDDFVITLMYAKTLLMLGGSVHFSLLLHPFLDVNNSRQQYSEASKAVEELSSKHGYNKTQQNLHLFEITGCGRTNLQKLIEQIKRDDASASWHTVVANLYLADVFSRLGADSVAIEVHFVRAETILREISYDKMKYG